jgi:hypothetical protein
MLNILSNTPYLRKVRAGISTKAKGKSEVLALKHFDTFLLCENYFRF